MGNEVKLGLGATAARQSRVAGQGGAADLCAVGMRTVTPTRPEGQHAKEAFRA